MRATGVQVVLELRFAAPQPHHHLDQALGLADGDDFVRRSVVDLQVGKTIGEVDGRASRQLRPHLGDGELTALEGLDELGVQVRQARQVTRRPAQRFFDYVLNERPEEVGGAEELHDHVDSGIAGGHEEGDSGTSAEAQNADPLRVRLRRVFEHRVQERERIVDVAIPGARFAFRQIGRTAEVQRLGAERRGYQDEGGRVESEDDGQERQELIDIDAAIAPVRVDEDRHAPRHGSIRYEGGAVVFPPIHHMGEDAERRRAPTDLLGRRRDHFDRARRDVAAAPVGQHRIHLGGGRRREQLREVDPLDDSIFGRGAVVARRYQ